MPDPDFTKIFRGINSVSTTFMRISWYQVNQIKTKSGWEETYWLIDKLNIECNKILTHSYKTNIFRTMIDEKLQCFLNELLKIRNLNNKRKNEHWKLKTEYEKS